MIPDPFIHYYTSELISIWALFLGASPLFGLVVQGEQVTGLVNYPANTSYPFGGDKAMKELTWEQISTLSSFVEADRFSTGQSSRELHLHDISPHLGTPPAGIIWPITTDEVSQVLTWTYDQGIPVTPWGAGTSTEGNPVPTRGGLVMDFYQDEQDIGDSTAGSSGRRSARRIAKGTKSPSR